MTRPAWGRACVFCRSISWLPARWPIWSAASAKLESDWEVLPEKVAVQLNDTHPAIAVPELMRILLDEAGLDWDRAWDITQRALAYTNHTLLPEALEKWPVPWFEMVLPRQLEIIYEINRRFLDDVRTRFPGRRRPHSKRESHRGKLAAQVRMANLAIVGTHSTNGVAAIHSELLRTTTVKDLAEIFPDRFNNKTNGVTPRRWLQLANPALARIISEAIGDGWITDMSAIAAIAAIGRGQRLSGSFLRRQARSQKCIADFGFESLRTLRWTSTRFSIRRSSASTSTSGNC